MENVWTKYGKRMEKSMKRASVSLARSPGGDASGRHPNVGTIYAYNRNRSKFFERKKHVDQQETTSDALYKDDCSGVMTANTLKQMTDTKNSFFMALFPSLIFF